MKIVHICISSPWSEIYAYQENLLPHYHRLMGHDVTIVAPVFSRIGDYSGNRVDPGQYSLADGSKVVRVAPLLNNRLILSHIPLVKGLKQVLIQERPDFLFVHDVACFNYFCLPTIKKTFPGLTIVFDNHGDYVNSLHSPLSRFLHKVIYRYTLVRKLIGISNVFYGVTPSRCVFLHQVYGVPENKIHLLVMGADDEKMNITQRDIIRQKTREQYGISGTDFLIVTGGKIDKNKNIHELANAVNSLERRDVKLLVFGKILPEASDLFEKEKSDRIITVGWIESDKVYELFYAADLIVFPGLHSVLWEQAVASKTPCAFSKIDGFDHLQINGNCIFMDGKDSKYYRSMLTDLLSNPDKYEEIKNNAGSALMEQFYYSNIAKKVLQDSFVE